MASDDDQGLEQLLANLTVVSAGGGVTQPPPRSAPLPPRVLLATCDYEGLVRLLEFIAKSSSAAPRSGQGSAEP